MIEIYDDMIPTEYQDELEQVLFGHEFPWFFWQKAIPDYLKLANKVDGEQFVNPTQMKHVFLTKDRATPAIRLIEPMVDHFLDRTKHKLIKVHAAAVLMQHPVGEVQTIMPHVDFDHVIAPNSELKTLIYYVNESDGDTILYNEFCSDKITTAVTEKDRISPKRGRAAVFTSNQFHSGSVPSKNIRVLITIIMEVEK